MIRQLLILLVAPLLVSVLSMPCYSAEQSIEGDWVGGLTIQGKQDAIIVHFHSEEGNIKGNADYPLKEQVNIPLSNVRLDSSRLHFGWEAGSVSIIFDGILRDGIISGKLKTGEEHSTLQLVRIAKINPEVNQQFAGLYEVSPGELIMIALHPSLGPTYINFQSGDVRQLVPLSDSTFFGGPALLIPTPIDVRVTLIRSKRGDVSGLTWRQGGVVQKRARKIHFRREEVTFRNGDVVLSGTLVLPNTKGPHPATFKIGGALASTRRNFLDEFYAYHGIAYLGYDKRGAGKSTGNWRTVGVETLAEDALAGIQYLKSRQDIDPKQIGVEGGSEGGWVTALVASRAKDIAYIILYAGPALSYEDEYLNEYEDRFSALGLSGSDLEAALEFRKKINEMIRSGEALTAQGQEKLQRAAHHVESEKWFRFVKSGVDTVLKNEERMKKLNLMFGFDPQPMWEKMTIPVLALYGGRDRNVPAAKNIAALEKALKKAGNKDYIIKLFPLANHDGLEAGTGYEDEYPQLKRHVSGYLDTPINWILRRVQVP